MSKDNIGARAAAKISRAVFLGSKGLRQRLLAPGRSQGSKLCIFVAGVQRSGTNMMMDVLEKHMDTDVYHERDQRAYESYTMRDVNVIRRLYDGSRAPYFVLKALCELQRLNVLMEDFAPSKAVWIVRDMEDVVNSMLRSFRNQAAQVLRIARDPASDGWRGEGMSAETHALVVSLTKSGIDDASAAALTWYFRNVLYFERGFHENPNVLLVSYERLVISPQTEIPRICRFLELEYAPRLSRGIFAQSIKRRAAPAIDPGVRSVCAQLRGRFNAVLAAHAEVGERS